MINKSAFEILMENIETNFLKNNVLYHTEQTLKDLKPID